MGKFKDIWNRKNDGDRKEERSFFRYAIVALVVAVVFVFVKKDNLIQWVQAGFTLRQQEKQIEYLKSENARLDEEISMLSSNKDSLERFARETYYFCEEGDDVYIEP